MIKASKASVHYTDHAENHKERCALCKYFEKGIPLWNSGCKIVMGQITAAGWCEDFKRAPAHR